MVNLTIVLGKDEKKIKKKNKTANGRCTVCMEDTLHTLRAVTLFPAYVLFKNLGATLWYFSATEKEFFYMRVYCILLDAMEGYT